MFVLAFCHGVTEYDLNLEINTEIMYWISFPPSGGNLKGVLLGEKIQEGLAL
jgi:hypothetical protein